MTPPCRSNRRPDRRLRSSEFATAGARLPQGRQEPFDGSARVAKPASVLYSMKAEVGRPPTLQMCDKPQPRDAHRAVPHREADANGHREPPNSTPAQRRRSAGPARLAGVTFAPSIPPAFGLRRETPSKSTAVRSRLAAAP